MHNFMHVNKRWCLCTKLTIKRGHLKFLFPASTVAGMDLAALTQALICGQSVLDTLHIMLRVRTCWNSLALGLNDIIIWYIDHIWSAGPKNYAFVLDDLHLTYELESLHDSSQIPSPLQDHHIYWPTCVCKRVQEGPCFLIRRKIGSAECP